MELQRLTTVFDVDTSGLQTGRVQVDAFFSDAERRAKDSTSRFDQIAKGIGKTLATGISVGLGDVGKAVDSMVNLTGAGIEATLNTLLPTTNVGPAIRAAFNEAAVA